MKKVYISQGHESGIGLEVLIKSIVLLSPAEIEKLHLFTFKDSLIKTLKSLNIPFNLNERRLKIANKHLALSFLNEVDFSESFTSLTSAMKHAEANGILFTLPTSKDQFPQGAGHTEYFRKKYKSLNLGMFFSGPNSQVLLVTDHIAVKELSKTLTTTRITDTIKKSLNTLIEWNWPIKDIFIAGLNPHAGEDGLIGDEDHRVKESIHNLKKHFHKNITGPFSGDTMYNLKGHKDDLLIYLFHDQGLGVFKSLEGFIGSNITLGLSFPRFSPDHGTSFSLFEKNKADYRGCHFSLKQALTLLKRLEHGQDSSNQSKGS